jgi:pyruvate dehydrogenase E2 component (dihydrolipoamide acetyltransferase)
VAADIYMPQLGLTMTEGKVVRWLKAAGDPVRKGEPLLEIETDKVSVEVESPADGGLGPILVEAGASAPIGGMLSHVLGARESGGVGVWESGSVGEWESGSVGVWESGSASPTGLSAPSAAPTAPSVILSEAKNLEAKNLEVKNLARGQVIVSPRAKRTAAALGIDLAQVEASGPGGRIVEADVRWWAETQIANARNSGARCRKSQIAGPTAAGIEALAGDRLKAPLQEEAPVRASPLARRLAQELGVDLTQVIATGPGGRIVEDDVRRAAAPSLPHPPTPTPPHSPTPTPPHSPTPIEPLSGVRRVVAERMAHSFATAPHFYLSAEVEATALARMREGLLAKVEAAAGARLTVTDILLKVCAQALAEFPDVNVAWAEDAAGGGIVRHIEVNVGLAVSVGQDGILPHSGLVVPVLRGADRLTLGEIARRRSDLVGRARGGKLTLTDLEGGAFTLSNLGMYGVDEFHAILNPPQAAILAVGRIKDRPVAVAGAVVVRPTLHLSLSVDHRVLDGASGARFLERVAQLIQEPYLLLE